MTRACRPVFNGDHAVAMPPGKRQAHCQLRGIAVRLAPPVITPGIKKKSTRFRQLKPNRLYMTYAKLRLIKLRHGVIVFME